MGTVLFIVAQKTAIGHIIILNPGDATISKQKSHLVEGGGFSVAGNSSRNILFLMYCYMLV